MVNFYNLLPWYICRFSVKHPGKPLNYIQTILETTAQREARNNAIALNLLNSGSLRVGVFLGFTLLMNWQKLQNNFSDMSCINKLYINIFILLLT